MFVKTGGILMDRIGWFVFAIYCVLLVVACTYVPWEASVSKNGITVYAGYNFIWAPPNPWIERNRQARAKAAEYEAIERKRIEEHSKNSPAPTEPYHDPPAGEFTSRRLDLERRVRAALDAGYSPQEISAALGYSPTPLQQEVYPADISEYPTAKIEFGKVALEILALTAAAGLFISLRRLTA
jgi:hypothetical protein